MSLQEISSRVVACTRCPRLVSWRESVAADPPPRFAGDAYWAKPVPGFGDPAARLMVVGLAPAAHGGNRTGRIFTGDRSGDWLFRALHKVGFANLPASVARDDGLRLDDCYVTAVVRCAPPDNKPSPDERDNCIGYLIEEIGALERLKVIVALGAFAWAGVLRSFDSLDHGTGKRAPKPKFAHLSVARVGGCTLIGSYHPSQQNTFTGRLTEEAFDAVFREAKERLYG
ncbi:MAG: uracil-DNA glycosylase [Actinomycetota bacterium]|nr:uracil-DNA glycosylase [Actinomycetota bacterium]